MLKRLVAIGMCCALLFLMAGCGAKEENYEEQAADSEAGYRRTILYYLADSGQIVPVMRLIPWEEGIGKAALGYLVGTEENTLAASAMGLETVLPQGVEFSLRIDDDGNAKLDLMNMADFEDAQAEQAMVTAVVNTLTEFSTIDAVTITLDGKQVKKMENGTVLSERMGTIALNVEDAEIPVSTGSVHAMTLYFSNTRATLNVPVTRYAESEPTFADAVNALITGPKDGTLMNCFPEGTVLNSAYISDGIACIDLSKEFCGVEDTEGLLQVAQDTVYLTANAIEEVYGVDIYVEGEAYSIHAEAASAPVYANEFK